MENTKYKGQRIDNGFDVIGALIVMDKRINKGHCYILPTATSIQFDEDLVTCEIGGFYEVVPDTIVKL